MDTLLLEQLTVDGHAEAVLAHLAEAGLSDALPPSTLETAAIRDRTAARRAVLRRDVRAAQALLPPGVLGAGDSLRLEQQAVLDELSTGALDSGLAMARARLLAPDAPWAAHAELRAEAERTMALFLYDTAAVAAGVVGDCPLELAALLSAAHRHGTADAVNAAMLAAGGHAMDARLPTMLREVLLLGGASGAGAPAEAALLTGGLRLGAPPVPLPAKAPPRRQVVVARRQAQPPAHALPLPPRVDDVML